MTAKIKDRIYDVTVYSVTENNQIFGHLLIGRRDESVILIGRLKRSFLKDKKLR